MSYITKQELIDRFGQDEMPELSGGGDDNAKIDAAIVDADGMINMRLRTGGYTTPVRGSGVTEIKRYAAQIVRYLMNEDTSAISETIVERYKEAVKWLDAVQDGKIALQRQDSGNKLTSVAVRRT